MGEVATVASTIGAVEEVLLSAKRPRARVAILAARSSSYWDSWETSTNPPTLDGVTPSLLALADAYNAEVFALCVRTAFIYIACTTVLRCCI